MEQLGAVADDLRQLNTDFGLRPYRVFSVVYRWTGGGVGRGEAVAASEQELLPTPFVTTEPIRTELRAGGVVERGTTRLREISPRYTEDQVRSLFHCVPLPADMQGFIEVRVDSRDGLTERRRFAVIGVPWRNAANFEWTTEIVRQDESRSRMGRPPAIDR